MSLKSRKCWRNQRTRELRRDVCICPGGAVIKSVARWAQPRSGNPLFCHVVDARNTRGTAIISDSSNPKNLDSSESRC